MNHDKENHMTNYPIRYKDIDSVMEAQRDLVRPVARLQTLLCVKG